MTHCFRIGFALFFCINCFGVLSSEQIQITENVDNKEKYPISSDELLHRHKILESYLSKSAESEVNWVETYNVHISPETTKDIETFNSNHQVNKQLSAEVNDGMHNVSAPFNDTVNNLNESSEVSQGSVDDEIKDKFPEHTKELSMYKTDNTILSRSDTFKYLEEIQNVDPIAVTEKDLEYKTSLCKRSHIERNIKVLFGIKDKIDENVFCPIKDIRNIESKSSQYLTEITPEQIDDSSDVPYRSPSFKEAQVDTILIKDHLQHQSHDLQQRHKILNSYKSKIGKEENWIETYDVILKANTNGESFNYNEHFSSTVKKSNNDYTKNHAIEVGNKENKMYMNCVQVRLYVTRWLRKLSNKFENAEQKSVGFSLSSESLAQLKELSSSENFDIVSADEFFSNLISDFTILQNDYSWSEYIPSVKYMIYTVSAAIVLSFVYSRRRNPFFLIVFSVIIIIISSIAINYYKMYQMKIAAKQHILSSISPSHCVNTLTANSGILDHAFEYFRRYNYNEDCKKYYETLMVDPEYEINFLLVITDLISNIFSTVFHVFANALNSCVKLALYDTYFYEKIVIIFISVFLILIYFRYKIKLPFISFKPSKSAGSQAQDINMPRRSYIKYIFSKIYQPALNEINNTNEITANKVLNLRNDSFLCPTNTLCTPEQFDSEIGESCGADKKTLMISDQSEKTCGDITEMKVEINVVKINNIDKHNTSNFDLIVNKICDIKDDSSHFCCTDIQCNRESSNMGSSTSDENCVGGINIELTQSTHVSEKSNNCSIQLPTECSEKIELACNEDIVIQETQEENVELI